MNKTYQHIVENVVNGKKMFAVLVDPEKCFGEQLKQFVAQLNIARPDFIFVGGSQLSASVDQTVTQIKLLTDLPVILFPGNAIQLCNNCDAILLLSLISGTNVEYIIGQHIKAAEQLKKSGIETISTGYILINGGKQSAVEKVSGTKPLDDESKILIKRTALAGELLGNKLIYLEAGSGALKPVNQEIIKEVKQIISVPLIVGGGISSEEQMISAINAGADIIVIGNFLEQHPEKLHDFCRCIKHITTYQKRSQN